jgi:hypothetical protein
MPHQNTPGYRAAPGSLQDHCGSLERLGRGRRRLFADISSSRITWGITIANNSRTTEPDDIATGAAKQIPGLSVRTVG